MGEDIECPLKWAWGDEWGCKGWWCDIPYARSYGLYNVLSWSLPLPNWLLCEGECEGISMGRGRTGRSSAMRARICAVLDWTREGSPKTDRSVRSGVSNLTVGFLPLPPDAARLCCCATLQMQAGPSLHLQVMLLPKTNGKRCEIRDEVKGMNEWGAHRRSYQSRKRIPRARPTFPMHAGARHWETRRFQTLA